MPLQPGQILGDRYRIVKHLAAGGMGAVYRAWDLRLKIAVALKEMVPLSNQDPTVLDKLREQFSQEATILAKLNHPNLVRVGDFFQEGGNTYLVMDFVDGEDLAEIILKNGAISEQQMLDWTFQLLNALIYCHRNGVVHRDIKPQNIIIRSDGQAILVDFGLVKLWNPQDPRTKTVMRGLGTPEYAPPEQYDAQMGHTDPRSDLYSLGACLYHALTGEAPPTATQRMAGVRPFQTPRTINTQISPNTEQVILRAMELKVNNRFPDAVAMLGSLKSADTLPTSPTPVPGPSRTEVIPQQPISNGNVPWQSAQNNRPDFTAPQTPPKQRRKWLPWLLGAGALMILFTVVIGCWLVSQVITPGQAEAPITRTPTGIVIENTPTEEPMAVPAPSNARLVLNHPSFANSFSSLDPIKSGWDKLSLQVASDAWVGLTRQNETTLEIERGMAVTWQVSDTGEEWLFHILPGVPWVHYNSETGEVERVVDDEGEIRYVSAYDFVYGLNRMITDPDSDYSYLLYPWVGNPFDESQISVVDDITFRVTLDKPAGHFDVLMDLFSAAMPSWLIESVGGKWTAPAYFQGYGPYVLKDFVTVESLTIIRNPYWLGTDTIPVPQFAEITWRTVPEDALLSAFEAGELDRVYLPNDAVFDVISSEANQPLLSSMSGGCEVHYEFNTRKPPFDSAKVRLAFALATDRNLIVDVEKRGNLPSFWYSPTDARAGLAMSGLPVPELSYDVQTANDLLDEVYPNRNEIPEIVISYYTSTGGKGLIATELERQWEENLGVTVEHLPFADSSEFTARIYADPPNIYRASVCGDYNDANAYYDPDDVMERLMTRSGWSDETFSAAIESAASSMDQDLRGRLYAQAEEILVKSQAVILPLRWSRRYVLTQPYLHPVESHLVQVERFEKWSIDE